jgi:hypothetical protein
MEFVKQVEDVYAFSKLIPQTGIDNETILLLHIYGIYSCFYDFIDLTNSPEILKLDIREKKVKRKNKIKENIDEALLINSVHFEKGNADDDEYEETLKEIEFDTGDEGEFKTQCCSLLLVFIEQGKNDKKIIDKTYADIMKRVSKSKKEEKDSITSYLENMEVDERKIEDLLKKYKLERWNAGQQSGLIKYDRQLYESQHEVNEIRLFDDLKDKEVDTNQLYRNILNNISAPVSDINDLNDYDMAADADPNIAYDRELPINDYYDGYDNGDGDGDYNDGDDNDID